MKRQFPVNLPEGYVDFFKNLETWQNEQQAKLKKSYLPVEIDVLKVLSNTNKPVLQSIEFPLVEEQYKEQFKELLQFLKNERPEITGMLEKMQKNIDQLDFNQLILKFLEADDSYFAETAALIEVTADILIFTVDHSLRPFLRTWAEPYYARIAEDEFKSWNFANICPFCGSRSHFSRLRAADGRRFMFCDQCFTEWETRNIYCVHCGNDSPDTIQYLTVEGDLAFQVYTCEECKGYLKTFDERQKGDKTDLFIANIETVYLDIMAQERGYSSHDNG
ncbi:MAG: formate dehydrogenase accessory protein FdhE [Syntrophomonas sp.]|nr:formate dehydrogenase accessory protein FdhE [Syntrophomonas sp.]